MTFGKGLNAWREEWEASEELQFQFRQWNDYAYRRLREVWDTSPDLQSQYRHDYAAFMTAAKKEASDALTAARNKASRDAAKQQAEEGARRGGSVHQFIGHLLGKR